MVIVVKGPEVAKEIRIAIDRVDRVRVLLSEEHDRLISQFANDEMKPGYIHAVDELHDAARALERKAQELVG